MKAMVTAYSRSGTIIKAVIVEDLRWSDTVMHGPNIVSNDGHRIMMPIGGRIEIEAAPEEIHV